MFARCACAVLALAPTSFASDSGTMPPGLADAVREAFLEEQYRVTTWKDGACQAANPAQGVSASFSPTAFEVSGGGEHSEPWTLGLRLVG